MSQQKYSENISNQDKSHSRSAVRDGNLSKDIPNMKIARPNTVGYKDINTTTKTATSNHNGGNNTKS